MSTQLQNSTGAPHARLLGVGAYRPSRVVTNDDVCQYIDSSDEWIRARSGIVERRFAEPHETVQMMSVAASRAALEQADIHPQQIGCIVVATVSHLLQTPAVATLIAEELGATPTAAFDISAACAGFCHGVALGSDMIRAGTAKYVLAIGVERLSDITDRTDRSTAFIFADGGGAAVLGPSEENGIGPVVWGSDGEQFVMPHLRMEGNPVFRWASYEMAKVAREALDRAGITVDDLDAFIPHQANMRITDAMARALKLPEHVAVARDITHQGNTSAASIPLAMDRMVRDGTVKSGDTALLIAFGAGLAYAAQVVTIP
jgi:3-oxoacyl-[acyl-carrier-protein] synthase-3